MKDKMDNLLEKALQPNDSPDAELNEKIIEMGTKVRKHKPESMAMKLARTAAVVLGVISLGSVTVYAANKVIKNVLVTDHAISVGNPDYIDDAAIAKDEEIPPIENVLHEEGDASVKWLTKDVQVVGGYATNTYYAYPDYVTAISDAGLDNWFREKFEDASDVTYVLTETEDYTDKSVNASYYYHDGSFFVSESIMTGNVAEDVASSIKLKNTNNVREYTSASGYVFTLVDEISEGEEGTITTTYVMIAYDDYYGYISFNDLSDEEIKGILDTVIIP